MMSMIDVVLSLTQDRELTPDEGKQLQNEMNALPNTERVSTWCRMMATDVAKSKMRTKIVVSVHRWCCTAILAAFEVCGKDIEVVPYDAEKRTRARRALDETTWGFIVVWERLPAKPTYWTGSSWSHNILEAEVGRLEPMTDKQEELRDLENTVRIDAYPVEQCSGGFQLLSRHREFVTGEPA